MDVFTSFRLRQVKQAIFYAKAHGLPYPSKWFFESNRHYLNRTRDFISAMELHKCASEICKEFRNSEFFTQKLREYQDLADVLQEAGQTVCLPEESPFAIGKIDGKEKKYLMVCQKWLDPVFREKVKGKIDYFVQDLKEQAIPYCENN